MIDIYTDGACSGNPGPGGWAAIVVDHDSENITQTFVGSDEFTTNNRMELSAVLVALNTCTIGDINIYSDSAYVVNAFNQDWITKWKKKDFVGVANSEMWRYLCELVDTHKGVVKFHKVKGHAGNKYNEMADKEACRMRDKASATQNQASE